MEHRDLNLESITFNICILTLGLSLGPLTHPLKDELYILKFAISNDCPCTSCGSFNHYNECFYSVLLSISCLFTHNERQGTASHAHAHVSAKERSKFMTGKLFFLYPTYRRCSTEHLRRGSEIEALLSYSAEGLANYLIGGYLSP